MGEHSCLYYHSLKDLCSVAASFFQDGIRKRELCLWIIPEGLGVEAAKDALRETLNDMDQYLKRGQLEIWEPHTWYTPFGKFDSETTLNVCARKEREVLDCGFSGLCVIGDCSWVPEAEKGKLNVYEMFVQNIIPQSKISALCTYTSEKINREEIETLSQYHGATLSNFDGKLAIFK